jgi:O-antigen/teichoic acid export membrane protein
MNKDIKVLVYIYSVRIYTAIITIALIPFIIKILGIESYGLIGFFTVLQACLSILDAGIGGVLTRQAIVSKVNKEQYSKFGELYKKIIIVFICVTILTLLLGSFVGVKYSGSWLKTALDDSVVIPCMIAMFWIFAIRYLQGPFRSILLANEKQVTITTINLITVTTSQPLALLLLTVLHGGVFDYFLVQLVSALLTTSLIIFYGEKSRRDVLKLLPEDVCSKNYSGMSLRSVISFALQLSTLSILWVIVNQSDKLALTKYMNLSDYGGYSVAVSVTAVLAILSDPLNQFLQPRLTKHYHAREYQMYSKLIINSFKFITLLTIPLGVFLFFYSKELLFVWSGDRHLSQVVSRYLPWIFMGSIFAVFSNIIFLILYSIGDLKKHTIIYGAYSIIIVPLNIYIAKNFLGEGASILFFISSMLLFVLWGGYNLNKHFHKGMHLIIYITLPIVCIEIVYFYCVSAINLESYTRILMFIKIFIIGILGGLIAALYLLLLNKFKPKIYFRES